MSMSSGSPNYYGAAQSQADSSRDVINAQTQANRPNVTTPWGSMNWTQQQNAGTVNPQYQELQSYINSQPNDAAGNARRAAAQQQLSGISQYTTAPSTSWGMNVELTPEQQQSLDAQQQIQLGRSELGQNLLGQANQELSQPLDYSSVTDARKAAEDAIYGRATSRLDPQWNQKENSLRTQLANQGLDLGSEAYGGAMDDMSRQRNDAYQQALYQAETGGGEEAQRQMSLESQRRGSALNELNSALSGQQVSMPSFPGYSQAGASQPTNYMSALNSQTQYNQQQQSNLSDIFGGGSSFLSGLLGFSDARLKRNIHRSSVEIIPGVRLAAWEWLDGSPGFGVIAQDVVKVAPQLVARHASGYLMVDHGGLI